MTTTETYKDQVFVALTQKFATPDDEARKAISDNDALIAGYEGREFSPYATARALIGDQLVADTLRPSDRTDDVISSLQAGASPMSRAWHGGGSPSEQAA